MKWIPAGGRKKNRDRVALCAIALGEDRYVDEWLQYHRFLGFDHVFLYDNSLEKTLRDLPEKYPGFVEVIHFTGPKRQVEAYNHRLRAAKADKRHRWIAYIDVDEFIVLRKYANIRQLLIEHCNSGALALNWLFFGSQGQLTYEPQPVLKRFTRRQRDAHPHVKCIVNVRDTRRYRVHHPDLKRGTIHDCAGRIISGPSNPEGDHETAAIFHFYTKSQEEFVEKVSRGRATTSRKRDVKEWEEVESFANEVTDLTALEFVTRHEQLESARSASLCRRFSDGMRSLWKRFTGIIPRRGATP